MHVSLGGTGGSRNYSLIGILNSHLLTVDDVVYVTLARLLVKFKKSLHITDGEVVIPTKGVKGKTVELYYEYVKSQEKATTGERGRMRMTVRQEGQQSAQANVKVWDVWAELKDLASGSHWSD